MTEDSLRFSGLLVSSRFACQVGFAAAELGSKSLHSATPVAALESPAHFRHLASRRSSYRSARNLATASAGDVGTNRARRNTVGPSAPHHVEPRKGNAPRLYFVPPGHDLDPGAIKRRGGLVVGLIAVLCICRARTSMREAVGPRACLYVYVSQSDFVPCLDCRSVSLSFPPSTCFLIDVLDFPLAQHDGRKDRRNTYGYAGADPST